MPSSSLVQKASKPGERAQSPSLRQQVPSIRGVLAGMFWVGYFLLIWLAVDPSLRIHQARAHFSTYSEFWQESVAKPGGVLEYIAAWAGLADWFPAWGALVATLLALAITLLIWSLARRVHAPSAPYLAWAGPFLLLLQQSHYASSPGQTAWGLLLVLSGSWGLGLWARQSVLLEAILFAILALALHYLTSLGLVLFILWSMALALKERKWTLAGVLLGLGAMMPLIGIQFLYPAAPPGTWMKLFWTEPHPWLLGAWLGLPTCSLILHFVPDRGGGLTRFSPTVSFSIRAFCLGMILFLPWALLDRDQRAWLSMDQAAQSQQWDKVLAQADRLPLRKDSLPAVVAWIQAHRALYHQNRLLEDLFRIPQKSGFPLFPPPKMGFGIGGAMSAVFLEMGQVNYAEHWCHEALELLGNRPEFLLRLATINQLHERTNAAKVFLGCLAGNPVWQPTAQARLRILRDDPLGLQDAEIAKIRPLMPHSDIASSYLDVETLLDHLLAANSQNRMAFEYLMAHYLLAMKSQKICQRLGSFQAMRYPRLPRLIEEAVLFQQTLDGQAEMESAGYQISPETRRDYDGFNGVVKASLQRGALGRVELLKRFSGTYWFYCIFGQNSANISSDPASPPISS